MRKVIALPSLLALAVLSIAEAQTLETTPLNILYRVKVGGIDYMTTASKAERNTFPSDGSIFYLPSSNIPGTAALYRLDQASIHDHMESGVPGEGGYTTEGILGYAWTTSNGAAGDGSTVPGLFQLDRVNNGRDHATVIAGIESIAGYTTTEGLVAWGFGRYRKYSLSLLTLSAGGVTIDSNGVAGGSLWDWYWNGIQFVNHDDFGREIQSSVFYQQYNPTEAGDAYSVSGTIPEDLHGSPWIAFQNSGVTQTSTSIPLDFNPQLLGGGSSNPVIYRQLTLGKRITLNYGSLGPVAEYVTTFHTPIDLPNAVIEIPTGYLQKTFNSYHTYDPVTRNLQVARVPPNTNTCSHETDFSYVPSEGYGAVITSDANGNAMGVYGVTTSHGGSVTYFTLWNLTTCNNTSKWDVVYDSAQDPNATRIASGDHSYHSWIMTGTISQVTGYIDSLYAMNVK